MDETGSRIYRHFADQLCVWAQTGILPATGNQDIRYGLELQRKRLERYQVRMEYELMPKKEEAAAISNAVYTDSKYTNRLTWGPYHKTVTYYLEGRKRLTSTDDQLLYTIITWLNQENVQETYCCPNCGTISKVQDLMGGCPNCKTRFLMSDLFPKVTDYHFLKDYGLTSNDIKNRIYKWVIVGILIGILIAFPGSILDFLRSGRPGDGLAGRILLLLWRFVGSGIMGALAGYVIWAFGFIGGLLKDGVRQAPKAAGIIMSRKKLNELLKPFDPGFSFEYFIGKVQALMKILIFTDDRKNLAVYEGPLEENLFDDIIDAQFDGALNLLNCQVAGNYCYLDLKVYMTDVYCRKNKVFKRSDVFQMGLCKNIRRPVNYGFSIKKVSCPRCGASFDASREKICPYCKTSYHLGEDDWVITYIRRM